MTILRHVGTCEKGVERRITAVNKAKGALPRVLKRQAVNVSSL